MEVVRINNRVEVSGQDCLHTPHSIFGHRRESDAMTKPYYLTATFPHDNLIATVWSKRYEIEELFNMEQVDVSKRQRTSPYHVWPAAYHDQNTMPALSMCL
jgi:hypothetical protein